MTDENNTNDTVPKDNPDAQAPVSTKTGKRRWLIICVAFLITTAVIGPVILADPLVAFVGHGQVYAILLACLYEPKALWSSIREEAKKEPFLTSGGALGHALLRFGLLPTLLFLAQVLLSDVLMVKAGLCSPQQSPGDQLPLLFEAKNNFWFFVLSILNGILILITSHVVWFLFWLNNKFRSQPTSSE